MKTKLLCALTTMILLPAISLAQSPAEWRDDLAEHMAGTWKLEGQVMGREAHHEVHADWVMNHQFLRIHEKTADSAPKTERPYEAFWFLGYDPVSERYVLHLMDVFGARYSETLGYGTRRGNEIRFVFEYPEGPFHTTYLWNPEKDTWGWLLEQKDQNSKWATFASFKLTRTAFP